MALTYRKIHAFRELRPGRALKVRWPISTDRFGYKFATVVRAERGGVWVELQSGARVRFTRCKDIALRRVRYPSGSRTSKLSATIPRKLGSNE